MDLHWTGPRRAMAHAWRGRRLLRAGLFQMNTVDTTTSPGRRTPHPREFQDSRLSATENETLVLYFFRLLQHRKWTILATLLALPLLTALAVVRMTPLYTAKTTVIYEPRQTTLSNIEQLVQPSLQDASIESQIEIIKSRNIIQATVDSLGLVLKPEFNPEITEADLRAARGDVGGVVGFINRTVGGLTGFTPFPPKVAPQGLQVAVNNEEVIRNVLARFDVSAKGRSSVIEFAFTSEDPDLAKQVVAKIQGLYIDNQLELKFQSMKRATDWLNTRLDQLRQQVEASEKAVEEFRTQAGIVEGVSSSLVTEEVSGVSRDLVEAQTALAAAQANLAAVRQYASSPGRLESIPEMLDNPTIRELRSQEATMLSREAELSARVGPRHPDLIELRASISRQRGQILAEVSRVSRGLENTVRAAQARVDAIQGALGRTQQRASRADAASIRLRALEREARSDQELLQTFLSRSKEISQQFEIQEPDARVLSPAYVPPDPSFPNTRMFILGALVIALILGLLIAALEEALDQTFRASDEVENALGLPTVAIPKIARGNFRAPFLDYVIARPASVFAETVRSLRTLLWLTDLQSRAKLVAITSSQRGEGKTTTAVSLARVAAQAGERVLIVDCDLTRPAIHTAFRQSNADGGLVDLLLGRASRREVTRSDPTLKSLHFITAGGRSERLGELLRSDNMIALMREVRNEYDLVVVDTPPSLVLSDARVLSTMADAVVYCIAWRSTTRSQANSGIKSLVEVGANVLCAALTQVKFRSLRYRDRMDHEAYAAGRAARSGTASAEAAASARA